MRAPCSTTAGSATLPLGVSMDWRAAGMGPFATRIGGDSSADAVLKDARISAVRALQRIPIADGDKETFGRIMKWSLRAHADDTLALVELRLDLTPGLAALIL